MATDDKQGHQAGKPLGPELAELRRLWNQASEQVRAAFLDEIPVEWLNASIIRHMSRKIRKMPVE
jgi:hypothetical protein